MAPLPSIASVLVAQEAVLASLSTCSRPSASLPNFRPPGRAEGVGGTVQQLYEYPYSPGTSDVPDHREQRAQIAAQAEVEFEAIRQRVMKKFPLLRSALRHAAGVILRVLPTSITGELVVAEISGLGGSGYTIGRVVTQDALHLVVPAAPSEIIV